MHIQNCPSPATGKPFTNFTGSLTCHMGHHTSKPIYCCKHGDRKLIQFINEIAKDNLNSFEIKPYIFPDKHLEIITNQLPKLSIKEKLCFLVTPIQNKALKMRNNGKIDYFSYRINETEYQKMKQKANTNLLSSKFRQELATFETYLRLKTKCSELAKLKKIIY